MPKFAAYGTVIESPVDFPELRSARARAEWTLDFAPRTAMPRDGGWVRTWRVRGKAWLSARPLADGWRLRFHRTANFDVNLRTRSILVRPAPGVGPAMLRHLVLDQVLPRALHTPSAPVLHASAAVLPGGIAAFVGRSGRGKSTLAAAFAKAGRPLFSDDAIRLIPRAGRTLAFPGYPGLRLGGDSLGVIGRGGPRVTEGHWKRRVVPRWAHRPGELRAIYLLERGRRIEIVKPSGSQAVVAIFGAGLRLGTGRERAAEELEGCVRLARTVPVRILRVPRQLALLPAVIEAVERDLRGLRGIV